MVRAWSGISGTPQCQCKKREGNGWTARNHDTSRNARQHAGPIIRIQRKRDEQMTGLVEDHGEPNSDNTKQSPACNLAWGLSHLNGAVPFISWSSE